MEIDILIINKNNKVIYIMNIIIKYIIIYEIFNLINK